MKQATFETLDVIITVTVHSWKTWPVEELPEGTYHAEFRIKTDTYDKAMSLYVAADNDSDAVKIAMTVAHGKWQDIKRMREKAWRKMLRKSMKKGERQQCATP